MTEEKGRVVLEAFVDADMLEHLYCPVCTKNIADVNKHQEYPLSVAGDLSEVYCKKCLSYWELSPETYKVEKGEEM